MRRIGSFCTGFGALDDAVRTVFGGEVAWVADSDPDVSKLLAHRCPELPNYGDITQVDWTAVPEVDILAGGYPCQPMSLAGKQEGMDDERWLWPSIVPAIAALRPKIAVFENVPNHLQVKMGFGEVTGDLHRLGYDMCWTLVNASDAGAPHRRRRLFMIAADRSQAPLSRPAGAGDPVALSEGGAWWDPQDSLFGQERFEGKFPAHGMMTAGRVYALPDPAIPPLDAQLLPTPRSTDTGIPGRRASEGFRPPLSQVVLSLLPTPRVSGGNDIMQPAPSTLAGKHGQDLGPAVGALLPTPSAGNFNDGEDLASWEARRQRNLEKGINGNAQGTPLAIAVQQISAASCEGGTLIEALSLLKTPTAQLGVNGGSQHPGKRRAGGHGPTLADQIECELLPTPAARDYRSGQSNLIGTNARPLSEVVEMLPDRAASCTTGWDWKQYEPAIRRWERVLGRDVPLPVEPGKRSRAASGRAVRRVDDGR